MLQKRLLAGRTVEVTFRMPPMDDVVELYLSGDFSGWKVKSIPFALESDDTWVARIELEAGKKYRFRYHDNQGRWMNDPEADGSVPNDFGSEDSILDLTTLVKEPPKAKAKKKAAAPKGTPGTPKKTAGGRQTKSKR
jgi:1,4-alpha-glucan branching enzyme